MPVTVTQVDLWRASPSETQVLEFKEAKTSYDREKLAEYCVALANEGGGHLIFGISDGNPRQVVGTQAFTNTVEIAGFVFQKLGFRVDVDEVNHPEGRVLVFSNSIQAERNSLQSKWPLLNAFWSIAYGDE